MIIGQEIEIGQEIGTIIRKMETDKRVIKTNNTRTMIDRKIDQRIDPKIGTDQNKGTEKRNPNMIDMTNSMIAEIEDDLLTYFILFNLFNLFNFSKKNYLEGFINQN